MDENNNISETLAGYTPTLSQAEKDALWNKIDTQLGNSTPTLSPYLFIFNQKKHMAPIALALMFMLGTTGIVAASETARPGDSLFVIEQKVEELRLALASDETKTRLEAQFAAERLLELSSILNESVKKDGRSIVASSTRSFEAEADVFSDTTIVEVELGDRKTVFETSAKTKEAVVLEIMSRFGVSRAVVEASLDFEIEDRSSRTDDRDDSEREDEDDNKDEDRLLNVSSSLNLNLSDDDSDDRDDRDDRDDTDDSEDKDDRDDDKDDDSRDDEEDEDDSDNRD